MRISYLKIIVFSLFLFMLHSTCCIPYADAEDSTLEWIGNFGTIDWVNQKVTATGVGVPPGDMKNPSQARAMAQRAAVIVARRNLLEVVKGVHIDSTTRVKNLLSNKGAKTREDVIVSRIEGVLQYSTVDDVKYFNDGTVEATVSMPLTGQLGQVIMELVLPTANTNPSPSSDVTDRINALEKRISILEDKIYKLRKIRLEQEEMLLFFQQFISEWKNYMTDSPMMIWTGYNSSDKEVAFLKEKIREQESRFIELSSRLDNMASRLSVLESDPGQRSKIREQTSPYTGLVIDARKTGFRPCLKPEIFVQGKCFYPGDYVNYKKAIRNGYVRYYRNVRSAQQSGRVGSLPYTIKAKGTYNGERALELDADTYNILKTLTVTQDSFMAECKVVIVF